MSNVLFRLQISLSPVSPGVGPPKTMTPQQPHNIPIPGTPPYRIPHKPLLLHNNPVLNLNPHARPFSRLLIALRRYRPVPQPPEAVAPQQLGAGCEVHAALGAGEPEGLVRGVQRGDEGGVAVGGVRVKEGVDFGEEGGDGGHLGGRWFLDCGVGCVGCQGDSEMERI